MSSLFSSQYICRQTGTPKMNPSQSFQLATYARCEIEEIQLMEKHKLSGTCCRIYLILRSFSREKQSCFPSLRTIARNLGNNSKHNISIVSRALRKLVELGLIIQNKAKSKQRFIMKASNTIRQKRQQIIDKNVNRTQTQEQKSLFNKRDTKKTKPHKPKSESSA